MADLAHVQEAPEPHPVYVEFPRMLTAWMELMEVDGASGLVDLMRRAGVEVHYSSAYQWITGSQVPTGARLHALMDALSMPQAERERLAFLSTLPKRLSSSAVSHVA